MLVLIGFFSCSCVCEYADADFLVLFGEMSTNCLEMSLFFSLLGSGKTTSERLNIWGNAMSSNALISKFTVQVY